MANSSSGASTVSREEVAVAAHLRSGRNADIGVSSDKSEPQLGLGLRLGVGEYQDSRVLIGEELPSTGLMSLGDSPPSISSSSSSSSPLRGSCAEGAKNSAEPESSPTGVSQAVGWPPIRAYRMNSMANQAKAVANEEVNSRIGENKEIGVICGAVGHLKGSLFVKVNMDGIGIGRKLDLNAHSSYESLAIALERMFTIPVKSDIAISKSRGCHVMPEAKRSSRLLDGSSDFVLTYEDKDGDWMLVGDVPWGLFLSSVRRLRIMKASDANGLDLKIEERAS